jgi:hypothetical protein
MSRDEVRQLLGAPDRVYEMPLILERIRKGFENLISNVIKYRDPEPPLIRVGAELNGGEVWRV